MEAGKHPNHNNTIRQDCWTPLLPSGFVLKLVIWSTWGDPFYVGLTGLEVYDAAVGLVDISSARVNATPFSSVAVLPNMAGDARTPDKLVRLSEAIVHEADDHFYELTATNTSCSVA